MKKGTRWPGLLKRLQASVPYGNCFVMGWCPCLRAHSALAGWWWRENGLRIWFLLPTGERRPEPFCFYLLLWDEWLTWSLVMLWKKLQFIKPWALLGCKGSVPEAPSWRQFGWKDLKCQHKSCLMHWSRPMGNLQDAVICNNSYNTCQIAESAISYFNVRSLKDLSVFVDMLTEQWTCGHMGTYFVQLCISDLAQAVERRGKRCEESCEWGACVDTGRMPSQKTILFEIKANVFYYGKATGLYHINSQVNCLYLRSFADYVIHFQR